MSPSVAVVIGAGGIGAAVTRWAADIYDHVVVADFSLSAATAAVATVSGPLAPHRFTACQVDVRSVDSLREISERASAIGSLDAVVHTAGVSPAQASVEQIVAVDLVGTALVLDVFADSIARRGAAVVIASMAGHIFASHVDAEGEKVLAETPSRELAGLELFANVSDRATAYGLAKRANQVRVRAAASLWGQREARVNSISPGVVNTSMGRQEMSGDDGAMVEFLIQNSPLGRPVEPEEIASAVAFLLSPGAIAVNGTDLLVDGGALLNL